MQIVLWIVSNHTSIMMEVCVCVCDWLLILKLTLVTGKVKTVLEQFAMTEENLRKFLICIEFLYHFVSFGFFVVFISFKFLLLFSFALRSFLLN